MRILYTIIMVLFLSLNASFSNSGANDPFANGGSERNMVVVISDVHLGANIAYAETNKNLGNLEKFLEQIRTSPNVKELVIAGDLFDEWFVPSTSDTYEGKDQRDFMARIAATNKGVISAFNKIIKEGNVLLTYVPGNHDLSITAENVESILPGINQARDEMQGLGTYSPAFLPQLAVEHGHRYNFFCAPDPISNKDIAPGSIMPPGYFFTRIATLHVVQKCKKAGDVIPNVTLNQSAGESQKMAYAYWNAWNRLMTEFPVKNKFDEKIIVTNIGGFKDTYSINDLMPYQSTPGGTIDVNLFKGIQDTWDERQKINKVAVYIPVVRAITKAAPASETDDQAKVQYFTNPKSNKRIVVFGHSHVPTIVASENYKGQKSVYANSGTWIDHNPGLTSMQFVVITPQNNNADSKTYIKLYNFEGGVPTMMAEDSLRY